MAEQDIILLSLFPALKKCFDVVPEITTRWERNCSKGGRIKLFSHGVGGFYKKSFHHVIIEGGVIFQPLSIYENRGKYRKEKSSAFKEAL